ncbi:hypothetical protein Psuf_010220 [Phytohabitans suffuscus]|uniref:Uncharacterized protein n=1 Tax=Phytohabitans suffuscus TaxID=624315 RepID=A0A6F8YCF8_9ACTN|nr:hypothetical protein Psuf_010220 [Phytohabitans suffuscus]
MTPNKRSPATYVALSRREQSPAFSLSNADDRPPAPRSGATAAIQVGAGNSNQWHRKGSKSAQQTTLTSVFVVSAGQGLVPCRVDTEVVLQLPPTALNCVEPQVSDIETVTSLPQPLPGLLLGS